MQHGVYNQSCSGYLKDTKRVNLKTSHHHKEKFCNCMVADGNQTLCGDHFTGYTNTKSLGCTPETNVVCQLHLKKK